MSPTICEPASEEPAILELVATSKSDSKKSQLETSQEETNQAIRRMGRFLQTVKVDQMKARFSKLFWKIRKDPEANKRLEQFMLTGKPVVITVDGTTYVMGRNLDSPAIERLREGKD